MIPETLLGIELGAGIQSTSMCPQILQTPKRTLSNPDCDKDDVALLSK